MTAAYEAALAEVQRLRTKVLLPGSYWQHVKTGNIYMVYAVVIIEKDLVPAVYYSAIGMMQEGWVRPATEFLDGRFEKI